ncbi:contractile injection system protein, VgrG/Pvc8 family [Sulfurimonas sp. NWX79]|uniref:phage late control D family protein n=1 Tax=Campylobacterales TaxID=213849 RepID=UPI00320484EB|nr:tail baseplate hub [Sulfurimonas phage SNW-1]
MTPLFKIEANGADVTAQLQKDLSSISFSDEDGNQSDEITLKVAGNFKRPKYQDEIKLWLGYEEVGLFYCGVFKVQSTQRDKYSLSISATGADFSSALKQKRDTSYEKVSLKDVAQIVASRHELKLKSDFEDMLMPHLSQTNESDLHMMKRLAKDYNGIFSIKNGTLVFLKRIKENMASDKLPVFEIDVSECDSYSIKHSDKTIYGACEASWHDTKENIVKSVTVGSGEPVLKLKGNFKTPAEAKAKAEAKLQNANRGVKSGTISMYGKEIYAGGMLKLSGAGEDDGEYSIKSVNHTFDSGWKMSIEIEN